MRITIQTLDDEGHVYLGKEHAGKTVRVEEKGDEIWIRLEKPEVRRQDASGR